MTGKKIIVVAGATGLQGGSVAKFLLEDGTFAVRAISRDVEKPKAKDLARKGAELIQADFNDIESLKRAFNGAYGVFANTNFWEPGVGYDGEVAQGKAMVDAAKATGIQHFIWSTLDRTEHKPAHWESKATVDDHLKASGVPRTSLYTTVYMDNFRFNGFSPLTKQDDGSYTFHSPMVSDLPYPIYPTMDTGGYVLALFKHPERWISKDLKVASQLISPNEVAKTLSEVLGKSVKIPEVTQEEFNKQAASGAIPEEIVANVRVMQTYPCPPFRDPGLSREVYPGVTNFKTWLELHKNEVLAD